MRRLRVGDKIKILEKKELGINENFKRVLITGGAQRIGSSITKHLANKGFDVAIQFNKSHSNIDKLKTLLKTTSVKFKAFQFNFRKAKIMKVFLKKLKRILEISIF